MNKTGLIIKLILLGLIVTVVLVARQYLLVNVNESKTGNTVPTQEVIPDRPCPIIATSSKSGDIIEEGAIANDYNGNEYPNHFRVVNGPQYLTPCYDDTEGPSFQNLVYVDSSIEQWQEIFRGPAPEEQVLSKGVVATSSISVLPGGRYVTYQGLGYESDWPVIYDLRGRRDVTEDVMRTEGPYFSATPHSSPTNRTIVFIAYSNAFSGEGWPTIWFARSFDPLVLEEIYQVPRGAVAKGELFPPEIGAVTINDAEIKFSLFPYGAKTPIASYRYDIGLATLSKVE